MAEDPIYTEDVKIGIRRRVGIKEKIRNYDCRSSLSRCELPKRFRGLRIPLIVAIDFMWILIAWGGVIGKLYNDSFVEFIKHYTNWNWAWNAIYYTVDFIVTLLPNRYSEFNLLMTYFWMLTCNNWFVFVLVFPMLLSNPGTITDNFKENGGDFDPGVVFVADRIFHVLTIVVWFFYFMLRTPDLIAIYNILFKDQWNSRHKTPWDLAHYGIIWYIIISAFYGPMFFFTYYNAFDFQMVYQVSTPKWTGMVIVVCVTILSIVFPIVFLSPIIQRKQENIDTKSWVTNEQDPSVDDIDAYLADHFEIKTKKNV